MNIVSNSSPLISLAKIGKLEVLEYNVVIPKAVFDEITKPKKDYVKELYKWGMDKTVDIKDKKAVEYLELIIGRGEAVGTIGVLLHAKDRGKISDVKTLLDMLIKKKIRISKELYNHALKLADE